MFVERVLSRCINCIHVYFKHKNNKYHKQPVCSFVNYKSEM